MADPLIWDGTTLDWAGTLVDWDDLAPEPAPPWPELLAGESGPAMLTYLPPFYERSTYLRAIFQALGYELDTVQAFADQLPLVARPGEAPDWALAAWEGAYGLTPDPSWSPTQRRAVLAAMTAPVVTVEDMGAYAAAFAGVPSSAVTIAQTGYYHLDVEFDVALSPTQVQDVTVALGPVVPVHLTFAVTSP